MFVFLKEVNDLIELGKSLDSDENQRQAAAKMSEIQKAENQSFTEKANSIKTEFKAFYTSSPDNSRDTDKGLFETALRSVDEYFGSISTKIERSEAESNSTVNRLKIHINAKREQITEKIDGLGGVESFADIKKYIQGAERISSIAAHKLTEGGVSQKRANEINKNVVDAVSEDPGPMQVLMLSSGTEKVIIDVIKRIFRDVKEENI